MKTICWEQKKFSYFEIKADVRNTPHKEFSNVYMYVNPVSVSIEKVMLNQEPLVNIDWKIPSR